MSEEVDKILTSNDKNNKIIPEIIKKYLDFFKKI